MYTYDEISYGGITLAGNSIVLFNPTNIVEDEEEVIGGILCGGTVPYNLIAEPQKEELFVFGCKINGIFGNNLRIANLTNPAGVKLFGNCFVDLFTTFSTSPGIRLSGFSDFGQTSPLFLPTGGVSLKINPQFNFLFNIQKEGGCLNATGESVISNFIIFDGGVKLLSSYNYFYNVEVTYNLLSQGFAKLSGSFLNSTETEFFVESKGAVSGGLSLIRSRYLNLTQGSIVISGEFLVFDNFVSLGGVVCFVSSNFNSIMREVRGFVVGGLLLSGKNLLNVNNNFFVTSSGSLSTEGSGFYFINDTLFVSGGGLSLRSDGTLINFKFNKEVEFKWNTDLKLEKKVDFYWNLGQQIMYWYRVVGKGIVDPCIPQDVCCGKIIVNLHARSLSELCQKLSKRKYKFPIETVERFNRPAETVVVEEQESNGVNLDCNNLVDVELCSIPECADFCVDQDISLKTGFYFKAWVVFQSTASGSLQTSGESSYVFIKKLPDIKFKSDGELFFDGNFIIGTNSFRGRGGCAVGGKSRLRHNRWSYNGGVWPNKTPKIYAKKSISLKHTSAQSPWLLPERAILEDNLFSSSDISFKKTSELLVLTNFSFDIPENSKVLKLVVNVDRVATKSGVRDKELFLIINDKVISNNLAVTNIDWPLLQTTKSYGSEWRGEDFDRYVDDPSLINLNINNQPGEVLANLSLEEIKNSSFGVAIRVQSVLNINQTIARINSINIEVEYEDPNGSTIRVSSNSGALAKSPAYTSKSVGKIYSYGSANARYTKRTVFKVSSFGAKIGGDSLKTIFENIGGGCLLSSSSKITPYLENPIINLKLGGESFVLPWWHSMSGGLKTRGSASRFERFKYQVVGGINIAGESFVPRKISKYFAAGGVNLLGSARSKKQNWKWISDGNAVFVIGQAINKSGNVGVPDQIFDFSMNLLKMDVYFAGIDKQDAEGNIDFFNKCGCFDLSSTMTLTHNFAIDNIFAKFLTRNNFTISKNLELRYNKTNDSWQNNLHYKGISGLGNYPESWNVVSEISCLNNIGGTLLGSKVWKVALQFSRNNLLTGDSYETRIVVAVLPDDYCLTAANRLEFEINYDTQSNFAVSNPAATIYQNTIYDNIGIFKNRAWIESPDLILKVTQSLAETSRKRVRMPTSTLSE
jgi:hypothetical protein